jgi:excisionase family DNA binding protein
MKALRAPAPQSRYASVKKASVIYDVSVRTIYTLIAEGKIKSVKLKKARRIDLDSMDRLFAGTAP